jgi:hypothetical protein
MNVHDYLIEQEGKDWNGFVSDWDFLLPSSFTIWFVNRFGDIVMVLDDGSVHFFDVGVGTVERVADNREHFCELMDLNDNANNWLMIPLTDACVAAGLTLGTNQCFSFKNPPILGGKYTVENVAPTDLAVHYSFQADICRQVKDLPDGTKIRVVVGVPNAASPEN